MKVGFIDGLDLMPVLVEPQGGGEASLENVLVWCDENRPYLGDQLNSHGAILFRGFEIPDADVFHEFARRQGSPLQNYVGGDSPRSEVGNKVYTSTEFECDKEIFLHNELSYAGWFPSNVFFYCKTPPGSGGQTTIGDSRRILTSLAPEVAAKFTQRGVAYIQNLHRGEGPGKSWQQTYETSDPAVVEAHCREHDVKFRWTEYGLWTCKMRDATITHPITGERSWFNQADQFHAFAPSARVDPAISEAYGEGFYPCHATYGDGSEISLEELHEVRRAFCVEEVLFDWQAGDVLMLDNLIAAHGRKPYTGDREILVALS